MPMPRKHASNAARQAAYRERKNAGLVTPLKAPRVRFVGTLQERRALGQKTGFSAEERAILDTEDEHEKKTAKLAVTNAWKKVNPDRVRAHEHRYYETHREEMIDKANARHAKIRATLNDVKIALGCVLCGTRERLEFHHRDPERKSIDMADAMSWKRVHEEIAKCDVLCVSCHRNITANLVGDALALSANWIPD